MKKVIVLLGTVSLLFSCTDYKKQQDELVASQWKLETLNGISDLKMAEDDSFTLGFDPIELRTHGKGDCNNYFSFYELEEKNELEFKNPGTTMMLCPNDNVERGYLKMLEEVDQFKIKDNKLYLMDDNKELAVFRKYNNN